MSRTPPVAPVAGLPLPNQLDLPFEDGAIVHNFQEMPLSVLLTDTIKPLLDGLHPDGDYCIGQDSGIYWRRLPDPPYAQAVAPDWFLVRGVPPVRDGEPRRSYVLWDEDAAPTIVLEFVSGPDGKERDRTPYEGKFWIYERRVRPAYYGIFDGFKEALEVYRLEGERFVAVTPNERGRFPIRELDVELGIWIGEYMAMKLPWVRWFASDGRMLPTGHEQAAAERGRAEQDRERAEKYAAKLRELGVDLPD